MKNSITEPPGSRLAKQAHRRTNVLELPQTVAKAKPALALASAMRAYRSVDDMVHELRALVRLAIGRKAQPSAVTYDAQTL